MSLSCLSDACPESALRGKGRAEGPREARTGNRGEVPGGLEDGEEGKAAHWRSSWGEVLEVRSQMEGRLQALPFLFCFPFLLHPSASNDNVLFL